MKETADPGRILLPPALAAGDTIGLVAPAGAWNEDDFTKGVRILSDYGFSVKFPRNFLQNEAYLAGKDSYRTEIFHDAWRDPAIKAILSVRGGYGSLRILDSIDFDLIRACPKPFIGFSDVTALHSAIFENTGLVTFHGPMLTTLAKSDKSSVASFFETLTRGACAPLKPGSVEILKQGIGFGRITGGNLTTSVHLLGTTYEVPWQDKIVFLEDIGEAPYRIDRMLTHLKMAGRFRNVKGLILGAFTGCGDTDLIWERVLELFGDDDFPIWAGFPAGHGTENMIIPMGIEAEMDPSQAQLTFSEPCFRRD